MDSIISNTSWAFIKSLGYDISDFVTSSSNSAADTSITISLSPFSFVFVDIVQQDSSSNPTLTVATIRPIMIPSNGDVDSYSLWMASYSDGRSHLINSAYNLNTKLIRHIATTSTSVTLYGSDNFDTCRIYVAAYAVA